MDRSLIELTAEGEMRDLAKDIGVARSVLDAAAAAYAALRRELDSIHQPEHTARQTWVRWIDIFGFAP